MSDTLATIITALNGQLDLANDLNNNANSRVLDGDIKTALRYLGHAEQTLSESCALLKAALILGRDLKDDPNP